MTAAGKTDPVRVLGPSSPAAEEGPAEAYGSSLEHLLDELGRIDLLLRAQIERRRASGSSHDDFRGLYISEEEVVDLLALHLPGEETPASGGGEATSLARLSRLEERIRRRARGRRVEELRLFTLAAAFALQPSDVDVLLLCLAPALDLRYERMYAYLQDDVTKKRPSVDLALKVLCPDLDGRLALRQRFAAEAPLRRFHLIETYEQQGSTHASLLGRFLRIDDRIAGYLLGQDGLDERLLPFCRLAEAAGEGSRPETDRLVRLLAGGDGHRESRPLVCLHGAPGVGKLETALAICARLGSRALVVECQRLAESEPVAAQTYVDLVFRESALQRASTCWVDYEALASSPGQAVWARLLERASGAAGPAFLIGGTPWEPGTESLPAVPLNVEIPMPDTARRAELWRTALSVEEMPTESELLDLAAKFKLGGRQVANAAAGARQRARWRDPEAAVSLADLYAACRAQSSRRVGAVAQKVRVVHNWDDLVLPQDQAETLREICDQARHRALVYETWGFGEKVSLGRGLIVLFAGQSGTGKTLGAEILAGELGLDLFKIDLATVVSKYIGETEKNLDRIFREAENCNAVLFFDEADALFGKRSEVRDSHDRYANIEIAYLLQKMEEYDGMAILATNLRQNLDEAFLRRMHFVVEFPFPEEEYRYRIWQRAFPKLVPMGGDADLGFLARQFKVAGGNIKNIALAAAFLAAAEGRPVSMEHLIRATKREFQKMGKLIVAADFQQYYDLVKGD